MNCDNTQELIPLYVGHDLDEPEAAGVAEHIGTCPECSRLCDEYSDTFRMVGAFTPPQFSDFVYSGIRRRVMDEVERQNTRPRFADRLATLISSYARVAAAAVVVPALGLGAFYYFAGFNDKRFVENVSLSPEQRVAPIKTKDVDITPGVLRPVIPPQGPVQKNLAGRGAKAAKKAPRVTVVRHRQSRKLAERTLYAQNVTSTDSGPPAGESTRMEIHTSDPNIRIIWFAKAAPKLNIRN